MGPRHYSRGNLIYKLTNKNKEGGFQWGHDITVVETWVQRGFAGGNDLEVSYDANIDISPLKEFLINGENL